MVLCKCSVDGDQNMYQIPTDIVVSCAHLRVSVEMELVLW